MEVIDFSSYRSNEDGQMPLSERIKGTLKYGFSWYAEMEAQKTIINRLNKILDDKFTIVRNAVLPDLEIPIPLILFGPHGITVIYTDPVRGIFRAKGEVWMVLDNRSRKFKPKRPNLITRTMLMTRAVSLYLSRKKVDTEHIEGVLILSDPGTHVDTVRPAVRIVLSDAVEGFASRLMQSPRQVSIEILHRAKDLITEAHQTNDTEQEEDVDFRSDDAFAQSSLSSLKPISAMDRSLRKLQRVLNFSKTQWIVLLALIFVELIILAGFILFVILVQLY